ncbi:hypothetical protein HY375_03240 [Candidatus Berkelbacteria bacterium]|nr:hypothetical protein [Candidatus Berkelbacteria bacterium]
MMNGQAIVCWMSDATIIPEKMTGVKRVCYREIFTRLHQTSDLFIACGHETYGGNGQFRNISRYQPTSHTLAPANETVTADVIYNYNNVPRPGFDPGPAVITNSPTFKWFCRQKSVTYDYLPDVSPATFYVEDQSGLARALDMLPGNRVVLKPDAGLSGIDVSITEKVEANSLPDIDRLLRGGLIVQEFLDTSAGIPGITESTHDLRIITINNEISLIHVRTPAPGSLVANTHRGASVSEVELKKLPSDILSFYRTVHARILSRFPWPLYSLDIAYTPHGPKLIELNGHTAFPRPEFAWRPVFIQNLLEHLTCIRERTHGGTGGS